MATGADGAGPACAVEPLGLAADPYWNSPACAAQKTWCDDQYFHRDVALVRFLSSFDDLR